MKIPFFLLFFIFFNIDQWGETHKPLQYIPYVSRHFLLPSEYAWKIFWSQPLLLHTVKSLDTIHPPHWLIHINMTTGAHNHKHTTHGHQVSQINTVTEALVFSGSQSSSPFTGPISFPPTTCIAYQHQQHSPLQSRTSSSHSASSYPQHILNKILSSCLLGE